ncbi:hypothetical protein G6F22_018603 [Rhizopus arrhizus]|nr:hypothetical protein G6F22_018603 [Rhizopus arrhizus]
MLDVRVISCTASATEEVGTSTMAFTLSWSIQRRAHGGPEVLDGHAGGFDGALAREVGVHAGQVGQDADADGLVGLRMRGRQREGAGDEQGAKQWFHVFPPGWVPALRRV